MKFVLAALCGAISAFGAAGTITITPSTWNTGNVPIGGQAKQTFTIKNAGSVNVTLQAATAGGANPSYFTPSVTSFGNKVLGPSQTTTISVTFAPPGTPGTYPATIAITSTAVNNPANISCTGIGYYHWVSLSWTASTSASDPCWSGLTYNVYRGTTSGGYTMGEPYVAGIDGVSYNDNPTPHMPAATTYYYNMTTTATYTNSGSCPDSSGTYESSFSVETSATIPNLGS